MVFHAHVHVSLHGGTIFEKEMKLQKEHESEKIPMQLWSVDISWEVKDANFFRFDRYFSSKMRALLVEDVTLESSRPCWN